VQLQEIDRLGLQVLQAALHKGGQVGAGKAGCHMGHQPAAGFGGDIERLAALLAQACQQALAAAIAIHIGGVEEVHPQVQRTVQRGHGVLVIDLAPGTPNGPGAEAHSGNIPAGTAERTVLHKDFRCCLL